MNLSLAVGGAALCLVVGCRGSVETATSGNTTSTSGSTSSAGSGGGGEGGGGEGGMGGGLPSDVTGSLVYHYYSDGGVTDYAVNLTGAQVVAFVMVNGDWQGIVGAGQDDGTFIIPSVPAGYFMLDVAGTYLYTSAREIDLGAEVGGRADAVYPMKDCQIGGAVQDLAPWTQEKEVEWFSPNAGGYAYGFASGGPATGATSLMNEPAPWYGSLTDWTKGDILHLTELSPKAAPSGTVYTIERYTSFSSVTQKDGGLTTVSGAFGPVKEDQTIAVEMQSSAFAKLGKLVNPKAKSYGTVFDLATAPAAGSLGLLGYYADLLLAYPGEVDAKFGKLTFANPFPAAWGTSVYAGESFSVGYTAPGASTPLTRYGSIYAILPADKAEASPVVPIVGPVLSPTIDGQDAFAPVIGVSTTPSISWKPPSVGTPSGYRITVYQLSNVGGTTQAKYKAMIATTTTSLTMPPAMLQKGAAYAFVISAINSPNDAATAPYRASAVFASADALTGMVTP